MFKQAPEMKDRLVPLHLLMKLEGERERDSISLSSVQTNSELIKM